MDNVIDSKNKFNLARAQASEARLLTDVRRVNAAAEAKMQAQVDRFINVLFAQHNRSQP